jgi:arylsulfatase A-like enzyme
MLARGFLLASCLLLLLAPASTTMFAARLSSLTLSAGQLSPAFESRTFNYTATVASPVKAIRVTVVAPYVGSAIRINGTVTASGHQSAPVALVIGPNTITVAVTARGRTDRYTVVVTRHGGATNTPPAVDITSPPDGTTFDEGEDITFTGAASDVQDGVITDRIRWTSNPRGLLGSGASVSAALPAGSYIVSASVRDSRGATRTDTVGVTVNAVPTVSISAPADGSRFAHGSSITFSGTASDLEDGEISDAIRWTSSEDGNLGSGATLVTALSVGAHVITASVTDSRSVTRTAAVDVTVDPADSTGARPNVLLIVADDVGAEASSLYPELAGNSGAVSMPNIESLAANGLVFDNAWASPMCSPTRATILSGLYGHHTGVTIAGDTLPASTTSLFEYIADQSPANYGMGVFGKWHLSGNGGNLQHVRDTGVPVFKGFLGAQINSYFNWTAVDINGPPTATTTYATTAITDFAIDYIEQHEQASSDPWFVYVPYNAAHSPNQVPPSGLHSVPLGNLQPGQTSNTVAAYKAMIQAMDSEIGRLLSRVNLDDTVVIYIGDNGTPANLKDPGARVRGSKESVYEGGVKVPMVVAGAGVTRRGRESGLVVSSDLYATIAALTGIPVRHINDSFSIVPLLTGEAESTGRTHAFTELCGGNVSRYAIRDPQHKLLYDNGSWGLYDLINDPGESNNLYNHQDYPAIRSRLQAELDLLAASASDGCFQRN